jgi:Fe-S-cluster containining protein
MISIDLNLLEEQAPIKWRDNWNFRAYLRQNIASKLVDDTVHQLNQQISAQIDCTKCANCCRQIHPHLSDVEVKRIADSLNIASEDFFTQNMQADGQGEFIFKSKPCPMLKDSQCGIYSNRPGDCASYPHLHHPEFLNYSVSFIENYRICPIVFHVYEELKTKFSYDPNFDYVGDEPQED